MTVNQSLRDKLGAITCGCCYHPHIWAPAENGVHKSLLSSNTHDCLSRADEILPLIQQLLEGARQSERETFLTCLRILVEGPAGAAVNAIREDEPEIARLVEAARAEGYEKEMAARAASAEPATEIWFCTCHPREISVRVRAAEPPEVKK